MGCHLTVKWLRLFELCNQFLHWKKKTKDKRLETKRKLTRKVTHTYYYM